MHTNPIAAVCGDVLQTVLVLCHAVQHPQTAVKLQTALVLCHAVQHLQTAVSYPTEKAASTLKQLVAPVLTQAKPKHTLSTPVFQQHLLITLPHGAPAHLSDMTSKKVITQVAPGCPSTRHLAQAQTNE